MKKVAWFISVVIMPLMVGGTASAGVWTWGDSFVAAFVDAEGINRHPGSTYQGERFEGRMVGKVDVAGPGVDVYYRLSDAAGKPVLSSVAGLEAWKPDGADWLGQGPTCGLGVVQQWGKALHMDATAFDSLRVPLWYKKGAGPVDVRVFCVTGTAKEPWTETQMDSATVALNPGEPAELEVDLTQAPDRTRLVKVGVVVAAHDANIPSGEIVLHIGSVPVATATLQNYGPNSAYRWLDVADQVYSDQYRKTYTYDNAAVTFTYNTVGQTLTGTLTAQNLKPNFAYQLKFQAEPTHKLGDTDYGPNELLGWSGRWWEQEWQGSSWTTGWNLNNKGNGSFPNPNDTTYLARRDLPDIKGGSPTGLRYLYIAYRVFEYFITDEQGNATLNYTVNNSYHVLWNKSQRSPDASDGPLVTGAFDVNPRVHNQYATDYPARTVSIFGEWERLPRDGIDLLAGDYACDVLLTEESFHGSGLQGFWAHAMKGRIEFTIVPEAVCTKPILGDLNNDCKVDFQDLAILSSAWMQCNLDPPSACGR
ncbi:MAG: hypothetical protein A2Y76_10800 [Planctomycetes bacterium RBG_13_60_9]|nr:MAG: hypothetical protein A2Y76_10800 [Planctomycetes bacterium RBG_13_60_9]